MPKCGFNKVAKHGLKVANASVIIIARSILDWLCLFRNIITKWFSLKSKWLNDINYKKDGARSR